MENAKFHPTDNIYSNLQIVFFPPNTTDLNKTLDCGIIEAFKFLYRKMSMRKFIYNMSNATYVTALTKEVNALDTIDWIYWSQK